MKASTTSNTNLIALMNESTHAKSDALYQVGFVNFKDGDLDNQPIVWQHKEYATALAQYNEMCADRARHYGSLTAHKYDCIVAIVQNYSGKQSVDLRMHLRNY